MPSKPNNIIGNLRRKYEPHMKLEAKVDLNHSIIHKIEGKLGDLPKIHGTLSKSFGLQRKTLKRLIELEKKVDDIPRGITTIKGEKGDTGKAGRRGPKGGLRGRVRWPGESKVTRGRGTSGKIGASGPSGDWDDKVGGDWDATSGTGGRGATAGKPVSILDGPGPNGIFTTIKTEVQAARAEYFAGVVREAVKKDIISVPAAHLRWPDQKLFAAKERDKTKFERAYIDVKGNNSDGYETDPKNCKSLAMKDFVNEGLAKPDNPLFKKFSDVVEGNGKIFADTLINLILKVKLYEKLAANKDLEKYNFGFALVTGVGNLTKVRGSKPTKFDPKVGVGKAVDLHTVLCGLRQLTANNEQYQIDVDFDKKEITDAAKIFFKISKANTPILNLELRYKGKFTPQPQFLGTITDEFHTILTEECLVKAK